MPTPFRGVGARRAGLLRLRARLRHRLLPRTQEQRGRQVDTPTDVLTGVEQGTYQAGVTLANAAYADQTRVRRSRSSGRSRAASHLRADRVDDKSGHRTARRGVRRVRGEPGGAAADGRPGHLRASPAWRAADPAGVAVICPTGPHCPQYRGSAGRLCRDLRRAEPGAGVPNRRSSGRPGAVALPAGSSGSRSFNSCRSSSRSGGSSIAPVLRGAGVGRPHWNTLLLACIVPLVAVPVGSAMALRCDGRRAVPRSAAARGPAAAARPAVRPRLQLDAGVRTRRIHRRLCSVCHWPTRTRPGRRHGRARRRTPSRSCYLLTRPVWPPGRSRTSSAPPARPGAGGWTALRTVTLPLLRPVLAAAAVLTFVATIESFAVPQVLGRRPGSRP